MSHQSVVSDHEIENAKQHARDQKVMAGNTTGQGADGNRGDGDVIAEFGAAKREKNALADKTWAGG